MCISFVLVVALIARGVPVVSVPKATDRADITYGAVRDDRELDYEIHVPVAEIPLGMSVGPSLEILRFRNDDRTGEPPWIARRNWVAVGDMFVSLEGKDISAVRISRGQMQYEGFTFLSWYKYEVYATKRTGCSSIPSSIRAVLLKPYGQLPCLQLVILTMYSDIFPFRISHTTACCFEIVTTNKPRRNTHGTRLVACVPFFAVKPGGVCGHLEGGGRQQTAPRRTLAASGPRKEPPRNRVRA